MDFIKGNCPYCQGELQIPVGPDRIICMYCAREILLDQKTGAVMNADMNADINAEKQVMTDMSGVRQVSLDEAAEALKQLALGIEQPMQYFKRALYMDFFKKYLYENAKNLAVLEQAYQNCNGDTAVLKQIAEPMVTAVDEQLTGLRGKHKEELQLDYNMSMVVYVFPALLAHNMQAGRVISESIAAVWKQHFPKSDLKAATAEEINSGFKYRFCYITTAVCESQNKPDDCYELELLRRFRDEYLVKSTDGEDLVHEYYDVAPTIVKRISRLDRSDEIYASIWRDYLAPCIRLIEQDEKERCVDLYKTMVYELKSQFFS